MSAPPEIAANEGCCLGLKELKRYQFPGTYVFVFFSFFFF